MTYFVTANKHGDVMENVKMGGYKSMKQAFDRFRKYSTSEIKAYTGEGLKTLGIRVKGKEYLL